MVFKNLMQNKFKDMLKEGRELNTTEQRILTGIMTNHVTSIDERNRLRSLNAEKASLKQNIKVL